MKRGCFKCGGMYKEEGGSMQESGEMTQEDQMLMKIAAMLQKNISENGNEAGVQMTLQMLVQNGLIDESEQGIQQGMSLLEAAVNHVSQGHGNRNISEEGLAQYTSGGNDYMAYGGDTLNDDDPKKKKKLTAEMLMKKYSQMEWPEDSPMWKAMADWEDKVEYLGGVNNANKFYQSYIDKGGEDYFRTKILSDANPGFTKDRFKEFFYPLMNPSILFEAGGLHKAQTGEQYTQEDLMGQGNVPVVGVPASPAMGAISGFMNQNVPAKPESMKVPVYNTFENMNAQKYANNMNAQNYANTTTNQTTNPDKAYHVTNYNTLGEQDATQGDKRRLTSLYKGSFDNPMGRIALQEKSGIGQIFSGIRAVSQLPYWVGKSLSAKDYRQDYDSAGKPIGERYEVDKQTQRDERQYDRDVRRKQRQDARSNKFLGNQINSAVNTVRGAGENAIYGIKDFLTKAQNGMQMDRNDPAMQKYINTMNKYYERQGMGEYLPSGSGPMNYNQMLDWQELNDLLYPNDYRNTYESIPSNDSPDERLQRMQRATESCPCMKDVIVQGVPQKICVPCEQMPMAAYGGSKGEDTWNPFEDNRKKLLVRINKPLFKDGGLPQYQIAGQTRRAWEASQGIAEDPSRGASYYDATWDGTKWVEPVTNTQQQTGVNSKSQENPNMTSPYMNNVINRGADPSGSWIASNLMIGLQDLASGVEKMTLPGIMRQQQERARQYGNTMSQDASNPFDPRAGILAQEFQNQTFGAVGSGGFYPLVQGTAGDIGATYATAKYGGKYEVGGEYDLTDEELEWLRQNGFEYTIQK